MVNLYNRGSYLGFECNFRFLKLPYFGCQVIIWAWNANCSHNCGTILFSRSTLRRIYFHNFFLSVASSEVLIQRCLLMKYGTSIGGFSFKITVLNIFGKIFRKTAVRELICSMVMRFQYALCREWFFTIFRKFSGGRFLFGLIIH